MTKSKPTRQDIIDAHDALEELCDRLPATRAAKLDILKALPPRPKPTMAEIDWDDSQHYLAEAEHEMHGPVVMLTEEKYTKTIQCAFYNGHFVNVLFCAPEYLTPTGRHYLPKRMQTE